MLVRYDEFKGGSGEIALAPRALLQGPNGSGKTRVLQAIQVALLGSVPALGQRGTAGLMTCGARSMAVAVEREGLQVERSWKRTATGIGGEKVALEGGPKRSAKDAAPIIGRAVGSPVALDIGEFLRLTPRKRAEMVSRYLAGGMQDADALLETLDLNADTKAVLAGVVRSVWNKDLPLADNLASVRQALAQQLTDHQATVRRAEMDAEEHAAHLVEPVSETEAAIARKLEQTQASRDQELALQSKVHVEREQRAAALSLVESLTRKIADAEVALRAALEDQQDAAEKRRAHEEARPAHDPNALASKIAGMGETITEAQDLERVRNVEWRTAQAAYDKLRASLEAVSGHPECPTCRQELSADAVAAVQALADQALKEAEAASAVATQAEESLGALVETRGALRELAEQEQGEQREWASKLNALGNHEQEAITRVDTLSQAVTESRAKLTEAQAKLAEIPEVTDEDYSERIAQLDEEISALTERQAAAVARRKHQERARELETRLEDARAQASTVRGLQSMWATFAARKVDELLAPITGEVGRLLGSVDASWSLRVDADQGLSMAAVIDGESVALEALSGGEAAIFAAAIAVAIVRLMNPPTKILMLEAAEVDAARLPLLLDALGSMAEDFDQIVVATCHETPAPEGWEAVRMGAVEAVA